MISIGTVAINSCAAWKYGMFLLVRIYHIFYKYASICAKKVPTAVPALRKGREAVCTFS